MDTKRKRPTNLKSGSPEIESASSSDDDRIFIKSKVINVPILKMPVEHVRLSRQDLAVNKTKVDAVDAWLTSNNQNGRLLLLNGPSGAGKTATILTLAAENGFQILEWVNPLDQIKNIDGQSYTNTYTSQAASFEDFLLTSGRYSSVIGTTSAKKMILVQEYPHTFNIKPDTFHHILQRYVKVGRSPIVFVLSDDHHLLFPPMFMADVHMDQISFNAVARGALSKAIDRIARLEGRENVSDDIHNAVCDASNGDLRNAIIAWQYQTTGLTAAPRRVLRRTGKRPASRKKDPKTSNKLQLDGKDEMNEFLPTVGRVLYAKRGEAVTAGSPDLDPRGFLKTDPQQVIDKFCSDASKFLTLAHENYITIFSDIDSAMQAADWLSTSDLILSEWRSEYSIRELGFSVGVRGLMNSCNNPILKWAPLRKSKWFQTSQKAEEHVRRVKCVYALNSSSTQALLLDIIPLTVSLKNNPYAGMVSASARVCDDPASPQPNIEEDSDSS